MSKCEKYFLKSSRLGFRLWCEDDLAIARELWGDYEVTKFFDARYLGSCAIGLNI